MKPLLFFILFALISCGLAFFNKMPLYKGFSVQKAEIDALVTLGMGIAFLLVTISRIRSMDDLKKSLVWINIGGIIFLSWRLMQIVIVLFFKGQFPPIINFMQRAISMGSLNKQIQSVRIPGLTLEPSWLAHSLNMLYLPLWWQLPDIK